MRLLRKKYNLETILNLMQCILKQQKTVLLLHITKHQSLKWFRFFALFHIISYVTISIIMERY